MNFKDKYIMITGAASGLGREIAKKISNNGGNLILIDINECGVIETKQLCGNNTDIRIITVDITNTELLLQKLNECTSDIKINSFVHCAGVPCIAPLKTLNSDLYMKVMAINTFSGLEISKWFANKKNHSMDDPNIVFISSVYGLVGSAGNVAYAMSKGAIQGITKALSIELSSKHIRVNCVAPGFMHTKMEGSVNKYFDNEHQQILSNLHPLGLGEAEDVANSVIFLMSDMSKWTTGAIFSVDGGFTAQ